MKKVVLYTTPYCPFCLQAKHLLDTLKIQYEDFDVSRDTGLRRKISSENGNWRTVPMILIGDEFIGGYSELSSLHKKGGLLDKINETN